MTSQLQRIQAASLLLHQDEQGGEELAVRALTGPIEQTILDAIRNQPRSLQKRIGPSEIGTPCDHCLAAKLAGWEENESGIPWASTVGTAIHELLERFFMEARHREIQAFEQEKPYRYFTEESVKVGTIGGQEIWGSTDLLDVQAGATVDWKCVAKSSLDRYKRQGPGDQYRVQAHLYAHGWNQAGVKVQRVSIWFLPRTTSNWYGKHIWSERYNPEIAERALGRANDLHNNLAALASISTEARDQWITGLPRADGCWSCSRYPDAPATATSLGGGITLDLPTQPK